MYVVIDQSYGRIIEVLGPFNSARAATEYVRTDPGLKLDMVVIKEVIPIADGQVEQWTP